MRFIHVCTYYFKQMIIIRHDPALNERLLLNYKIPISLSKTSIIRTLPEPIYTRPMPIKLAICTLCSISNSIVVGGSNESICTLNTFVKVRSWVPVKEKITTINMKLKFAPTAGIIKINAKIR